MTSTYSNTPLEPVFLFVASKVSSLESAFYKLPGSAIIERYVRSSHQNDPGRTLLELLLVILVINTLLQSRTRADGSKKNFIEFSEKVRILQLRQQQTYTTEQEIDELVDEWAPESLATPLSEREQAELSFSHVVVGQSGAKPKLASTGKNVLNLTCLNFTNLAGNEVIKDKAIEALRKYGVGSCGPPGFYGTTGMLRRLVQLGMTNVSQMPTWT